MSVVYAVLHFSIEPATRLGYMTRLTKCTHTAVVVTTQSRYQSYIVYK